MWFVEQHSKQLFKPLLNAYNLSHTDRNKGLEADFPSCISSAFVPRQKFFIALFKNKKVCFFVMIVVEIAYNALCFIDVKCC